MYLERAKIEAYHNVQSDDRCTSDSTTEIKGPNSLLATLFRYLAAWGRWSVHSLLLLIRLVHLFFVSSSSRVALSLVLVRRTHSLNR